MIDKQLLKAAALEIGVEIDDVAAEKFDRYAALLVEWNQKMNLTAITEPTDMVIKHFVDSVAAAPLLPNGSFSLVDVGTGAGFPGVPLAILRPDCKLTLLDSLNKRLVFLDAVCKELGIAADLVHMRAEEGGRNPAYRDTFDVATARAVGGLPLLCEYCLPYVKVGGRFLALKGPTGEEEAARSAAAIGKLGGKTRDVHKFLLPADSKGEVAARQIYLIDKVTATPTAFPRPTAKIAKKPL
ncbi:MAG: 16S rRNA (guanine(527)-N(7))-methyltransferase RsmG [Elusimicrobiaceae bacterium]|nr:16S rRNA (guanine(527)-N(7))-methyltransferase RsmG [Clostridia bacterium]MBP3514428.1 16S rRNA (guanine(527)-N(7))-methyltransferase RsmG [Elusimicrobiaceae bacterium]